MPRVCHFDLNVKDVARARKFYTNVFGWKIESFPANPDYWLIMTGPEGEPGIDGGMSSMESTQPTTWLVSLTE